MSDLPQAAGSGCLMPLGGRTWELRPLTLRDWGLVEREALQYWKDQWWKGRVRQLEHLPPHLKDKWLEDARRDYDRLDLEDIPPKYREREAAVLAPNGLPAYGDDGKPIKEKKKEEIPYANWWPASTLEGRLCFIWLLLRRADPNLTVEAVNEIATRSLLSGSDELSNIVNQGIEISQPNLGNAGAGLPEKTATPAMTATPGESKMDAAERASWEEWRADQKKAVKAGA